MIDVDGEEGARLAGRFVCQPYWPVRNNHSTAQVNVTKDLHGCAPLTIVPVLPG